MLNGINQCTHIAWPLAHPLFLAGPPPYVCSEGEVGEKHYTCRGSLFAVGERLNPHEARKALCSEATPVDSARERGQHLLSPILYTHMVLEP